MPILKFIQPPTPTYPRTFAQHIAFDPIRDHDGDPPLVAKARGLKLSGPTPTPGGPPDQVPLVSVDDPVIFNEYPNPLGADYSNTGNGNLYVEDDYGINSIALDTNEFALWYIRPNGGYGPGGSDPDGTANMLTLFMARGLYDPGSDSTTIDEPIAVFGGRFAEAAIPPFTNVLDTAFAAWRLSSFGDSLWPQVVALDRTHFVFRWYDQGGWTHSYTYGDGTYGQAIACMMLTIDWDADTVTHGPISIIQTDFAFGFDRAYEYQNSSGRAQRMAVFPDGRLFHGTTDWNFNAVVCRIGQADLDTGVITWGPEWVHPDARLPGTPPEAMIWRDYTSVRPMSWVIGDTRVAYWFQSAGDINGFNYRWKILIFDVNPDDTLTLYDWALVTTESPSLQIEEGQFGYNDGYWDLIQPQPGQFVSFVEIRDIDLVGGYLPDLFYCNVNDIVSNSVTFGLAQSRLAFLDPIYEDGPDDADVRLVQMADVGNGAFVISWFDETTKVHVAHNLQYDYYQDATLRYVESYVLYPSGALNKGFQSVASGIANRNTVPGSTHNFSEPTFDQFLGITAVVHSSDNLDLAIFGTTYDLWTYQYGVDPYYLPEIVYNIFRSDLISNAYAEIVKLLPSC